MFAVVLLKLLLHANILAYICGKSSSLKISALLKLQKTSNQSAENIISLSWQKPFSPFSYLPIITLSKHFSKVYYMQILVLKWLR